MFQLKKALLAMNFRLHQLSIAKIIIIPEIKSHYCRLVDSHLQIFGFQLFVNVY